MGCIRWLKNSNQNFSVIFQDFRRKENSTVKQSETIQCLTLDASSLERVTVTNPLSGLDMQYRTFQEDWNDFSKCGASDEYSLTMNQSGAPKLRTNLSLEAEHKS